MTTKLLDEFSITNKDIDNYRKQTQNNNISRIWNKVLKNLPENLKNEAKKKVLKIDFAFEFDQNRDKGVPLRFRILHSSKKLSEELLKIKLY